MYWLFFIFIYLFSFLAYTDISAEIVKEADFAYHSPPAVFFFF